MAVIKTPDQKVRVFISSTINELQDERKAAREAISNLRLTPVFFEAGARPHPPRDLYSAYLDQSHIFLGIYWNSYGWIAPGAEISGLEDEYRLCGNKKPKLIYVKDSTERQPKLDELLLDIQNSDTACYQKFHDAAELKSLIENDLSILMSETFETALFNNEKKTEAEIIQEVKAVAEKKISIPAIRSEIIGREADIKNITELLLKPSVHLVNILGAGGTGKTTLSIHLAHALKESFHDGVVFIPLAPVTDANIVAGTIADELDLQDSGKQPISVTIIDYLKDKNMLLVLDNFEQILDAAQFVSDITQNCSKIKILVTSRSVLNLRSEHVYHLLPLSVPGEQMRVTDELFLTVPSVKLFVSRAQATNNQLNLNEENKQAIATICTKLDGLPLAIELAASRTKLFQPSALVKRMDKLLDLASKGQKDLPHRQQTLRNAIEWSYNLLDEESKEVFRILGIFKRSWTLEAADAIIQNISSKNIDIEDVTEKLLNVSLIKPVLIENNDEPRFNMLQTVFEFAGDELRSSDMNEKTRQEYTQYFLQMLNETEGKLWNAVAEPMLDRIEYEYQNIRAAFYFALEDKNYETAWRIFYLMVPYWTIRGGLSEALEWKSKAGISGKPDNEILNKISIQQQSQTLTWAAHVELTMLNVEEGYSLMHLTEDIARKCNDKESLCLNLLWDGGYGVFMQYEDAEQKFLEGKKMAEDLNHHFALCICYSWGYEYYRLKGDLETMKANLEKCKAIGDENNYTYIHGNLFLVKMSLHVLNIKGLMFDDFYSVAMDFYAILPAKGYKGLKAAALASLAFTLMEKQQYEEAEAFLFKSIEFIRESGEKEGEFYALMQSAEYFMWKGNTEFACKLLGALDAFIETIQYPIYGSAEVQYNRAKNSVYANGTNAQMDAWYREGKKIKLEEAIILISQSQQVA